MPATPEVRIFRYIEELDAFVVTEEYTRLADVLGLTEWHPAVWIGRLFAEDNDYGEHWFDNWDEREELSDRAKALGIDDFDLMVVIPNRFARGNDGPCNTPEFRKAFWTDVLKSFTLSLDTLFQKARHFNEKHRDRFPEDFIPDLEQRIESIKRAQ